MLNFEGSVNCCPALTEMLFGRGVRLMNVWATAVPANKKSETRRPINLIFIS